MFSNTDPDDSALEKALAQSHSRLQRAGSDGVRITSFKQVMARHGLLILVLALLCILMPNAEPDFFWGMRPFFANPAYYSLAFLALFLFLLVYSQLSDKVLKRKQIVWIGYLLFISIAEEWIFRLVLPGFLAGFLAPIHAVVISNLFFASIHYFTLRWRLVWVVLAFFGGMGLSRMMSHGDLMLLVWVHWLATFLNTPFPPGVKRVKVVGTAW